MGSSRGIAFWTVTRTEKASEARLGKGAARGRYQRKTSGRNRP